MTNFCGTISSLIPARRRLNNRMSLNSVVNRLVRAAASVPADISDTDLDSHVARLLAEEGRANDAKWSELGLGAFVGSSGQASSDAYAKHSTRSDA